MSISIHLDNVSKSFRLGSNTEYGRLTEAIVSSLGAWFRNNPQPDPNLRSSDARYRDGWFWALKEIQLQIESGEIVGIVGRNGAGKSTILKLLSRIIQPTSGRVGVRGRVGSLLEVGTGFHPELTGRENVFLNGAILGMPRNEIRKRFDDIVAFAEVDSFLDTPVKRYSSGMAVRLAFAVAAHLEPDVLIVDEVLAVGDQAFQSKCMDKASELGKQGRTVLIVSHNLASVANLCSRAVLMREGRLVADDKPDAIIDMHLKETVGIQGTRHWTPENAPMSSNVRLRSVQIHSGSVDSAAVGEVDIDRETMIAIEYDVLQDDVCVTPQIKLKDEMASYVFWTTNASSMCLEPDPLYARRLKKGRYRAICTIPANLLNESRYFVSVLLGPDPSIVDIQQETVLSFLVKDTGAMRKEYHGSWVGPTIRPRLGWNTSHIDSDPNTTQTTAFKENRTGRA